MTELEDLVARMTALDSTQRPATIAEVQTALQLIAAHSQSKRGDFQPLRPPCEQMHTSERPTAREHSAQRQEQMQEQVPEQMPLPPADLVRRKLIIGGLLTGVALAVGVGSLYTLRPQPSVKPRPVPPTVIPVQFGPDAMFGFDAQHAGFNAFETRLSPGNVSSLQLVWLSQPIGTNYFSSPTVSGGLVYVGTSSGSLCALDAETGHMRWVTPPNSATAIANFSTPAVVKGVVYVCLGKPGDNHHHEYGDVQEHKHDIMRDSQQPFNQRQ